MRRLALGVFTLSVSLLAGDAFVTNADLLPWARTMLLVLALLSGLYWLATTQIARPRLPSLAWEQAGPGFGVRLLPPERAGRRRLKRETHQLVTDMYAYIAASPGSVESLADHRKMVKAMEAADSEDQKQAIWERYTDEETRKSDEESRENSQRFGGQVEYLLDEYERRKLIDHSERNKLLWELGSTALMARLAQRLDSLVRKL